MNKCPKCEKTLYKNNTTGYCVDHSHSFRAIKRRLEGKAKLYYEKNKEKMLAQAKKDNRKSYEKHKEKRKAKVKQYRETNWELVKEQRRVSYRHDSSKVKAAATRNIWNKFSQLCEQREILNEIPRQDYEILIKKPCYYCGVLRGIYSQSTWIDRINNKEHYKIENVHPCCPSCNIIKHNLLSVEEMIEIVKLLKNLRNRELIWQE